MIDGVKIVPLRQIPDERGKIMHMLRCTDPHFEKFGEVYFSVAYPGVIKGWHLHTKQTQFYAVVSGMIKLVLFDERKDSKTKGELMEIFTGEDDYKLIRIPVGVVNGYKTIGVKPAIVANCATLPHEEGEMLRYDPLNSHIKYDWSLKHR
ncbi:MAG: dTDP-4-dehydrorhamnose 3,5-epimerase family protein [Candidatus Saganbacteria bacterium]|nr:dTDP-4-dehydrorhamnose 3,5-epimerase family protein [Candidatus Saganbacteria bacterium]